MRDLQTAAALTHRAHGVVVTGERQPSFVASGREHQQLGGLSGHDHGRTTPGGGEPPPEATDEAIVGGIASLLARRVLAGETAKLGGLLSEIAEFALTPYLGAAETRRIISER